jgi:signal transduction histidine kinase
MKIKASLFCWFFLLPLFGFSKSIKIDSLEAVLKTNIHDTTRFELLEQIITELRSTDLEKALDYNDELIALSNALGNDEQTLIAHRLMLYTHYYNNTSFDTVSQCFDQAKIYLKKVNNSGLKSDVLNIMGTHYRKVGQYIEGLALHEEALDLAETGQDTIRMIKCLNNMALLLENLDEDSSAKKFYSQALAYSELLDKEPYIASITNNMGVLYLNEEVYDSALVMFSRALELKRKMGNELSSVTTLANVGRLNIEKEQYELAKKYLDEAYEIATRLDYPYGKALSLKNLSLWSYAVEKYAQSIAYANEGLRVLKESENIWILETKLFEVLGKSYEETGNYKLALKYYKTFKIREDSILAEERVREYEKLEFKNELAKKEVENKLLKSEQIVTEKTLRNRTYIGIVLILAFILALGWALTVYRSNQQKKKINAYLEEEVKKRTQELESINKDLEQANYELKTFNYIASHDIKEPIKNIGNYVGLIQRQLPEEQKSNLNEYFQVVKKGTTQLYTLLEDFARYTGLARNETIDLEEVDFNATLDGVKVSLQSLIQEKNGHIQNLGLPNISTSPSLSFVAIKNLVENGLKFNETDRPTVTLSYEETPAYHEVIVSDNGIGVEESYFDHIFEMFKRLHPRERYSGSGIGLAIVKLVMEKLGGNVQIKSEEGKGSEFRLQFPKFD